ncbi:MAG: multicopper oxidase domain-containing protein [Microbacteriaceae bacterium]|nr:multicopper oxidase domain-containing protein [Microbacteriaceae bacterium]
MTAGGGAFSRRQAIGIGILGALGAFAIPMVLSSCSARRAVLPAGLELTNPPVRRAGADGRLTGPLVAKIAEVDLGIGAMVRTYTFDGALPGATWDVRPGETIAVELRNELPEAGHDAHATPNATTPAEEADTDGSEVLTAMVRPHAWTTTNLHTHGLHVSPSDTEQGAGDNVFLVIEPGQTQKYDIRIPEDHTGGFFWYHPHVHGGVKQAVRGGMAGAIIVRGEIDEVPEVAAAAEKILVLQDVELTADYRLAEPTPDDPNGNYWPDAQEFWVVNGQYRPVITMRPGEVQRWRLVNAAASSSAQLTVSGHPIHVLAYDGYTLAAPQETQDTLIVPGGRVELLIRASTALGSYDIELLPTGAVPAVEPTPDKDGYVASPSLPRVIATVRVEGDPADMALPERLPAYDPPIRPIAKRRTLSYDSLFDKAGDFLGLGVQQHAFDPDEQPYRMKLGTAEEWQVDDMDDGFTHVFHIHINPFLVTEVNGEPMNPPQWRDTFPLGPDSFKMQMNLDDFTGKYVDHCHYVDHEDMGMMEAVEVID